MPKKTKSSYIIVDKEKNFCHGAFEHSEEGFLKAEEYLKLLQKTQRRQKKAFKIIEK
jgi:hypothetical protein